MSRVRRMLSGLLALSMILLSGCAGGSPDAPEAESTDGPSAEAEPSAGQIVFEGLDLEGNAVSSEVFSQSKLTVLNVWATYCNPCLSEMPGLGELAGEYAPEEVQIIGVVSDVLEGEDTALAESLATQTGAAYPHLLLNESIYYALLTDVTAVPTTFFIDGSGTVVDTVIGAMEKTAWEETINGLLEEL